MIEYFLLAAGFGMALGTALLDQGGAQSDAVPPPSFLGAAATSSMVPSGDVSADPDAATGTSASNATPAPVFLGAPESDQSDLPMGDQTAGAVPAPVFLGATGGGAAAGAAAATEPAPAFLGAAPKPDGAELVAEPQTPTGRFTTATEVRPILEMTRTNWVALREYDGKDLIYVTQLWAWRCGLLELRIGLNGAPPSRQSLPDCHEDQPAPNAILDADGLPFLEAPLGSVESVEVQLTYDDLSTDVQRFERATVLRP